MRTTYLSMKRSVHRVSQNMKIIYHCNLSFCSQLMHTNHHFISRAPLPCQMEITLRDISVDPLLRVSKLTGCFTSQQNQFMRRRVSHTHWGSYPSKLYHISYFSWLSRAVFCCCCCCCWGLSQSNLRYPRTLHHVIAVPQYLFKGTVDLWSYINA